MLNNITYLNWIRKFIAKTVSKQPAATAKCKHLFSSTATPSRQTSCGNTVKRSILEFDYNSYYSVSTRKMSDNTQSNSKADTVLPSTLADGGTKATTSHTNRLINEKSPYLLQHAHNPVDWYPWCDEAIKRAREENKLIFLSVGYSTCHWCHVMEHESFENEAVAAIMNKNFINIKVDREERPDIDKIYMQFVLMLNGSGGWPMSVWLTPDLAPITAGTYFPPHDRWGMPSFSTVLKTIASKWQSNQDELKVTGKHVIAAIQKSLSEKSTTAVFEPGSADAKLQESLRIFKRRYDQQHGGFGTQPKFPEVSRLKFLLHAYIITKDADVLDMVLQTLQHIGHGGIHDHVFGGFARYSVDRVWHVPHFEKMLYDQGQLMTAYASAYKLTNDKIYMRYADGIFRYLMKDLRHPGGGFFAGEDADSLPTADARAKVEGAFYAWTWAEVKAAVDANATLYEELKLDMERIFEIYTFHYDLRATGNVEPKSDPHGHLTAKNIHIVRGSVAETCDKFGLTEEQLQRVLYITNEVLHKIRDQRPRPHLDTKIICAWNGLVLSGLAQLANCGGEKRDEYAKAAEDLYKFMHKHLYDNERKVLLRSCYGRGTGDATLESIATTPIDGFLDDYAFLIRGLLDYYKTSLDGSVLKWARELQEIQDVRFWDNTHGAYFYSEENSPNVIVRLKEDHDGAEPCGNSIAARNLILLSHYLDEKSFRQRASKLLEFFADVNPFGYTLPAMMSALLLHENGLDLVAVVGPDSNDTRRFVEICQKFYIPGMIILHVDPQYPDDTYNQRVQQKFKMINGKTTVYICHDRVCQLPFTDPEQLEQNLKENFFKNEH
ncbi:spermatogenesis-associated protein 20 isoform X2 [Eurosta solidaginis]|uniref:spermatogenesis-associated protein 20 isoform X2 n=1 Tax=Eurosta solidaginis TaxID=178769 RepID=UPI0035316E8F